MKLTQLKKKPKFPPYKVERLPPKLWHKVSMARWDAFFKRPAVVVKKTRKRK